jgi:hypothetical protein
MKKGILLILLFIYAGGVNAQKESNTLKKHEIKLLSFLLSDTINSTSFSLNNTFNFDWITPFLPIPIS